ncbi:MAG: hypothetical protein JEZ07_19615 [Phycisphaerae bacterium]|nr:hypothetical protein [Phycisphaerae bacterium]
MNNHKRTLLVVLAFFAFFFLTQTRVMAQQNETLNQAKGGVVDQFGKPVTNANVHIRYYDSSQSKKMISAIAQTNEVGVFMHKIPASKFDIFTVKKRGYEYVEQTEFMKNSIGKPILIEVYKDVPAAELVCKTFKFEYSGQDPKDYNIDVLKNGKLLSPELMLSVPDVSKDNAQNNEKFVQIREANTALSQLEANNDVRLSIKLAPNKNSYIVTLTVFEPSSGIVLNNRKLKWTPAKGYQNKISLNVPIKPSKSAKRKQSTPVHHIYLKTRQGTTYSRLDFYPKIEGEKLIINIQSWSNDKSSQNLKQIGSRQTIPQNSWKFKENRRINNKLQRIHAD